MHISNASGAYRFARNGTYPSCTHIPVVHQRNALRCKLLESCLESCFDIHFFSYPSEEWCAPSGSRCQATSCTKTVQRQKCFVPFHRTHNVNVMSVASFSMRRKKTITRSSEVGNLIRLRKSTSKFLSYSAAHPLCKPLLLRA